MATVTWIGNAHATRQISTITVGGTWVATETATLTINSKDLVLTVGSTGTSTANVATSLQEMWMASSRLDGTGTTNSTSNAGGQEFGEFGEVTASVSGSVVTLIGNTPGKPFTVSVAETSTSGTLSLATPQAATGPHHWNNADNWDTGSVPVDDDTVVFRDTDVDCLYGLPDATDLECTIHVYMSYQPSNRGWGHNARVGLPRVNEDDPRRPYNEYRQRYVRLDDGGSGTDIAHRFGIGSAGAGFSLFNLKHITVKCSPIVYGTGAPQVPGTKSLNICCTANDSTLNILGGSVDFSSQDSGTSAFRTVKQTAGDSRGIQAIHTASSVLNLLGGTALVGGTGAIVTVTVRGGSLTLQDQTGTITTLQLYGGVCVYASTATVTTLVVDRGATFDARTDAGGFTLTTTTIYGGGRFLDPGRRMTIGTTFKLASDPSGELLFGAAPDNTITASNA